MIKQMVHNRQARQDRKRVANEAAQLEDPALFRENERKRKQFLQLELPASITVLAGVAVMAANGMFSGSDKSKNSTSQRESNVTPQAQIRIEQKEDALAAMTQKVGPIPGHQRNKMYIRKAVPATPQVAESQVSTSAAPAPIAPIQAPRTYEPAAPVTSNVESGAAQAVPIATPEGGARMPARATEAGGAIAEIISQSTSR